MKLTPGSISPMLFSFYTRRSPNHKNTNDLTVLLGSASVKTVRKTLMILTPVLFDSFAYRKRRKHFFCFNYFDTVGFFCGRANRLKNLNLNVCWEKKISSSKICSLPSPSLFLFPIHTFKHLETRTHTQTHALPATNRHTYTHTHIGTNRHTHHTHRHTATKHTHILTLT